MKYYQQKIFSKKVKRIDFRFSFIFFVLLLSVISFSCNSKNDGNVTLNFWGLGSEGESLKKIVPEFEKENPDIKVNVQMIPWTAAQEKLISAYAGDNTPDLCQLGNTWIAQFRQLDAIISLNPFINKSKIVNEDRYYPGIWDTNVIDSLVYDIP